MSTSIREQVTTVAGHLARTYPIHVNRVVEAIERDGVQAGKEYLRSVGGGSYAYLLNSVTTPTVAMGDEPEFDTFDKATACEVIRAFITQGSSHLGSSAGASPEQVTALLQIAGLEDVPEPEPEAEFEATSVDPGLFARLVSFARGHGFSG